MKCFSLKDISALLTSFEQSTWAEMHVRCEQLEMYVSRAESGLNPMRQAQTADDSALSEQTNNQFMTAPHLGTFIPTVETGAEVTAGEELGSIQVLDEYRPVLSAHTGSIVAIHAGHNAFIEFGHQLFEIKVSQRA